uniref:Probable WRKY transcription factor 27 n=1 Tax=Elaeis guineensis var. tenera TaxID=51953 RepID=A0A8N4EWR0_ELAGV|nr:probable WRKY transcription factor 27 [Elaeis guineensis]
MFIITYTAKHNHPLPTHRNSLADSTRQKFPPPPSSTTPPPNVGNRAGDGEHLPPVNPSSSPPSSSTTVGLSPTTPLTASMEDKLHHKRPPNKREDGSEVDNDKEEEEEGVLLVEDMEVMGKDGLLFMGLDESSRAPVASIATSTTAMDAVASTFFDDDGDFGERSHWSRSP